MNINSNEKSRMDRVSKAGRSSGAPAGAISKSTIELLESRIAPASLVVSTLKSTGVGSLSAAITQANTNGGSNTITFTVHGTIHLTALLPAVTDDLAIQGPGAGKLTIDGGKKFQILYFSILATEPTRRPLPSAASRSRMARTPAMGRAITAARSGSIIPAAQSRSPAA